MLGRAAVTDHQARPAVAGGRAFPGAIAFQPVDGHAMLAGTADDGTLETRSGKFKHRMQTGGDPGDLQPLAAEGGGQAAPKLASVPAPGFPAPTTRRGSQPVELRRGMGPVPVSGAG